MPLTTYTVGEVLTASSLNANLSFASTNGGLVRVGGGALSGSSTTFSSVFSSTYDAYKIVVSNGANSGTSYVLMTFGATATGYITACNATTVSTSAYPNAFSTITTGAQVAYVTSTDFSVDATVVNPNLAKKTFYTATGSLINGTTEVGTAVGFLNNSTVYTAFTLAVTSGTLSGTCNIYGYSLS